MEAKFKIRGQEYGFKTVTLRAYYSLLNILNSEDKDKEFKIVEAITDCPVDMLKKLTYTDWLIVWEETQLKISGLKQETTEAIQPTIKFDGVEYGLPAIEDLTIGEFADLNVIFADSKTSQSLERIAAVLYRPIKKKVGNKLILEDYDTEGFQDRCEKFLDLPLTAIKSANAFFLQSAIKSLKSTAESLLSNPKMESIPPDQKVKLRNLLLSQPELGGDLSIPLLEQILSDMQKLPSSKSVKVSIGSPGKKTRFAKLKNIFKI